MTTLGSNRQIQRMGCTMGQPSQSLQQVRWNKRVRTILGQHHWHLRPNHSLSWGVGSCPVHCRILGSIPGHHPLDVSGTPPHQMWQPKVSPDTAKCPWRYCPGGWWNNWQKDPGSPSCLSTSRGKHSLLFKPGIGSLLNWENYDLAVLFQVFILIESFAIDKDVHWDRKLEAT